MNRIDTAFLRGAGARAQTVSEVVFDFLRRHGMTRIFGNPGSTEIPMFVNLPADFSYVLGLQEATVVGMADGYAQIAGAAQFVNLHSAAGLGNALGAIYTAYRNRAPLVIVTGQQSRALLPHDPFLFNENPTEFPKPYVKWASEPARAADVPAAIAKAYYIAMQPPRGPVVVSVPLSDWDELAAALPEREIAGAFAATPGALDSLAGKLEAAREPVIVVGPVVDIDGAWEATVRLAERLQAKVWASPKSSRASFPESHPLFAGFLPAAQPALMNCLKGADFILVLGAPVFTYHFPGSDDHVPDGADLCLVTDDPKQAAGAAVGSTILSNMRLAAEGLAARVKQRTIRTEPARASRPRGPGLRDHQRPLLSGPRRGQVARQHPGRGGAERRTTPCTTASPSCGRTASSPPRAAASASGWPPASARPSPILRALSSASWATDRASTRSRRCGRPPSTTRTSSSSCSTTAATACWRPSPRKASPGTSPASTSRIWISSGSPRPRACARRAARAAASWPACCARCSPRRGRGSWRS